MFYKIHMMINHSIAQAGAEQILEKVAEKVTEFGGKVHKKILGEMIKVETLIKKSDTARYAFMIIEMPTNKLVELNYEIKVTEGIDRHIVLNIESASAEPATFPVVTEKDYRKRPLDFWKANVVMENPSILRFFLTPRGKILSRKFIFHFTGQEYPPLMRQLSNAVKQARFMGWLRLK